MKTRPMSKRKPRQKASRKKYGRDYILARIGRKARRVIVGKNMIVIGRIVLSAPVLVAVVLAAIILTNTAGLTQARPPENLAGLPAMGSGVGQDTAEFVGQIERGAVLIAVHAAYGVGWLYEMLGYPDSAAAWFKLARFLSGVAPQLASQIGACTASSH